MTVIETHVGGRRAAARDAAETRKKLLLAGLAVVLVALLAFELPKIMNHSSSASSTGSTSLATTANPSVARCHVSWRGWDGVVSLDQALTGVSAGGRLAWTWCPASPVPCGPLRRTLTP